MQLQKIAYWTAGAILFVAVSLHWWSKPLRQVRRAQGRLISAIEKRDFDAMARLLADDYKDRWRHDKAVVVRETREAFKQFATLSIDRDDHGLEAEGNTWLLAEKLKIKGLGGPVAIAIRDEVNSLKEPFRMAWRRRGWKPWDWELVSVGHPELELPR